MQWLSSLTFRWTARLCHPSLIYYAGVTPNFVGLYQLNIRVTAGVVPDPVIQVSIGAKQLGQPQNRRPIAFGATESGQLARLR